MCVSTSTLYNWMSLFGFGSRLQSLSEVLSSFPLEIFVWGEKTVQNKEEKAREMHATPTEGSY